MSNIIMLISIIVRQFYLPNPFYSLGDRGEIYNFALSGVLGAITYVVVGMYYKKGSVPAVGSFLYLVFFMIHLGLIESMGVFDFNYLWVALVLIIYTAIHIAINRFVVFAFGGEY